MHVLQLSVYDGRRRAPTFTMSSVALYYHRFEVHYLSDLFNLFNLILYAQFFYIDGPTVNQCNVDKTDQTIQKKREQKQ